MLAVNNRLSNLQQILYAIIILWQSWWHHFALAQLAIYGIIYLPLLQHAKRYAKKMEL